MPINKICSKCKKSKNILQFPKSKHTKDGYYCYCKKCTNQLNKNCPKNKRQKYNKTYNQNHKKQRQINSSLYYQQKQEYYKKYNKEYFQINKKSLNIKRNIYIFNRKKQDINFKILLNLRSRINKALKLNIKSQRTIKLLDCSVEFLKKQFESKFTEGMSWNNYGRDGWEIDHIRPCASFDLSKKSEQKKCFNYKNLQPLWAKENLQKSDKINVNYKKN